MSAELRYATAMSLSSFVSDALPLATATPIATVSAMLAALVDVRAVFMRTVSALAVAIAAVWPPPDGVATPAAQDELGQERPMAAATGNLHRHVRTPRHGWGGEHDAHHGNGCQHHY